MTLTTLTEQVTLAGLRQQAERLNIQGFPKMRIQELIKAIGEVQDASKS